MSVCEILLFGVCSRRRTAGSCYPSKTFLLLKFRSLRNNQRRSHQGQCQKTAANVTLV